MTVGVTFWGVRGSVATPGPDTVRYGGNTPCVSLTDDDGRCLILDAGTGIRALGEAILGRPTGPADVDVLLSHSHWDHIQGLPFFGPLYQDGARVRIHGPAQPGTSLREVLQRQMDPSVFPIPLAEVAADLTIEELDVGLSVVSPWRIDAVRLQHPGIALGYRVRHESGGPSLAYVTDNELGDGGLNALADDWYESLVQHLDGVDVLIHDAMYAEKSKPHRIGWGHSTPEEALELALACGSRHLVLFHHDPAHEDEVLDQLVSRAQTTVSARAASLTVEAAREGSTLSL